MDKPGKGALPFLLLLSVFVVATCGLIYELIAGTLASYLLGDSVTQFSTIIGVYLFSMGIGSYFSKFFSRNLIAWFIQIEILIGLIGGTSSSILYLLFDMVESFRILLYLLVSLTGILVGVEIPLLMRILEKNFEFKELVSKVFTFDYIGALLASVIFPLLLVPYLGIVKTSYLFGILNVLVALIVCIKFEKLTVWAGYLKFSCFAVLGLLMAGFVYSEKIISISENLAYTDKIVYSKSSPYQRIVLTKNDREIRLFLNGNLQFSSADEYRYHEALVHPGLQSVQDPKKVLVLGGGDGLAVREVLKYKSVESVTLVDLDKDITTLFSTNPVLTELNKESLLSLKVTVINTDAFHWLKSCNQLFDFIVIDFPDPSNYSVGKLYTNTFYRVLYNSLAPEGAAVIQSTSPYVAPKSYWCVDKTLRSVGFKTVPFHNYVPSFGDWGYILVHKKDSFIAPENYTAELKYLTSAAFKEMLFFPKDMEAVETEVNKLNNQVLVNYFEDEWGKYLQ